jgi:hypothetical protein
MKNLILFEQFISRIDENTDTTKDNLDEVIKSSGYGAETSEYAIAKIIATKEGWNSKANKGKGTRAYRNNNPGNLDYQEDFKTIDPKVIVETLLDGNKGRYAKFSEPGLGAKALIEKKIIKWANGGMPITSGNSTLIVSYKGGKKYVKGEKPTIAQFFYTYAPPNENKTEEYINGFITEMKKTKPDITRDTLVSDLLK